jgi:hypothetical protein
MTTIQEQFKTLMAGVAGDRVYPRGSVDTPVAPYVTYFRVSGVEENILYGSSGLTNTRLQIDVFSSTYAEAQSLASTIKTALKGWAVQNVINGEQDLYEDDTKLHRVLIDVSIWHN